MTGPEPGTPNPRTVPQNSPTIRYDRSGPWARVLWASGLSQSDSAAVAALRAWAPRREMRGVHEGRPYNRGPGSGQGVSYEYI